MSQDTPSRYTVPALARGLQLLSLFTPRQRELTGAHISRTMGLPRASVFRMLQTLEQMGFVERTSDAPSYKLGIAILRLGFEFLASMELTEHGRHVIEALRDACGYSAHVVVRDVREVVFICKIPGRSALFHPIHVGARLPAHATVLGRVLLGGLSLADLRALYDGHPLDAYTPNTPTTLEALKAAIDDNTARGYGMSEGGYEAGISIIAAPVYDERRDVCAAVSITVPSQTIDPQQLSVLTDQVRQAAAQLTKRLSHTGL